MTIWVIGGTSESREIARMLSDRALPWVATVASDRARRLYAGLPGRVRAGCLTAQTIDRFLDREGIQVIIDASHPFAVEISQLAIATKRPYLRFERSQTPILLPAVALPNLEALLVPDYLAGKRVLLLLGVKALPDFRAWHDLTKLWARVLPESRELALAAGFPPEQLILETPPVPAERERLLWQNLQIDAVATKASGRPGGFETKQAIARELDIPLYAIARPPITYPRQTDNLEAILEFYQEQKQP
ncbi:MAG: precorrin-6A reductase [Cyanobacteria bacterium J06641_5]